MDNTISMLNREGETCMKHQNIFRADVNEDNLVTIALTKNMWDGDLTPDEAAGEWGRIIAQLVKAVAKTMDTEKEMSAELAELKILNAIESALYSAEEPSVTPGLPVPGDDSPETE